MKKHLLSVLIMLTFCNSGPLWSQSNSLFDGFFTGISLGTSILSARIEDVRNSTLVTNDITAAFIATSITPNYLYTHTNRSALSATVYAGYGLSFCDAYYFAVEGYGNNAKRKMSIIQSAPVAGSNNPESTVVKVRDWEYGLDFKPGFLICDALFYGRIGLGVNRLKIQNYINYTSDLFVVPLIANLYSSVHRDRAALRLGLGLEHNIFANLNLRCDYIFTFYRKLTLAASNTSVQVIPASPGVDNVINTLTLSNGINAILKNQAIMIGINYYW